MSDTRTPFTSVRFGKWAGLVAGVSACFADQQINSMVVWSRCPKWSMTLVITVGGLCVVLALMGGIASLSALRRLPESSEASHSQKTDRFIATLSLLMATFSVLAIVFATPAGWILRCER